MNAGRILPDIHVVAALLRDHQGRVLLAERPAGKPMAGWWEFPGGKIEQGEPAAQALSRELREELGIAVEGSHRLLRLTHDYPERRVHLDVWRVTRHQGTPAAYEGQRLAWVRPDELKDWKLLPADEPIVLALKLPPLMLVTPESADMADLLAGLERSLAAGIDLVQFRAPGLDTREFESRARAVTELCHARGAQVVVNAVPETAKKLGADGVHLSQANLTRLAPGSRRRDFITGISCHSAKEMAVASAHDPDCLLLGPVQESASHPGMHPLGWERFAELVKGCLRSGHRSFPRCSRHRRHPRLVVPGRAASGLLIGEGILGGQSVLLRQPVTQVDEPAAIAAEGLPLGIVGPRHRFAAMGAGDRLNL
jgi:8-oxo-dGTP diphosphatase